MNLADKDIAAALDPFGVTVDPALAEAIRRYIELLLKWNRRINLTSITDPQEILARHFGESLFAAHRVPIVGGTLVDVGSGAGFPGLALKLVCPALTVKLLEPVSKKMVFLAEVARTLNLTGIEFVAKRTEEYPANPLHADYLTARGVGDFEGLLSWAAAGLRSGGRVILWLGADDADILAACPGWLWEPAIKIPQSAHRVLLVGRKANPD